MESMKMEDAIRRWFEVGANALTNRFPKEPVPGVKHYLNHDVLVTKGPHAGTRVTIISLNSLEPEPAYLAELSNGSDITVRQSEVIADAETWETAEGLQKQQNGEPGH